ncbi:MAG: 4Fe-4S binding protein [Clostridia bacterium]|nr:4Fe-4S binding protein [Clostridia bacterium]MBQ5904320.1 4Fe-4S binding protein [Clostridia bacterium]
MDKKKKLSNEGRRNIFQFIWALITNSFAFGFAQGKIYTGKLKTLCLPGLNCYSCPGAVASCPIGSLQAVISSRNFKFSFYVVGFMVFIGAIFGRFVCGWLCPFGLLQDLLHKIPFPKKIKTFKGDKLLRNLKYVILLVFVIILPMCLVDITGLGEPWFCKFICPAGTLEGGIPLTAMNESLRKALGFLWAWKFVILVLILVLSVIIYRPFCKYLCPLGGVYSLFNGISVFRLRFDENKCVSCNKCSKVCKMNVDPTKNPDHTECIRCGLCVEACPTNALTSGFVNQQKKAEKVNKSEKK